MKLTEALPHFEPVIGKKFETFLNSDLLLDLHTNKGNVGQLLERLIGLKNNSRRLDFEDGELKTNKADLTGKPKETMFITQISENIDEIFGKKNFTETHLYYKIKNMVYLPVCKEGAEKDWMFLPYIHVNLEKATFRGLLNQLEQDYYSIAEQLITHANSSKDGFIHTSNGKYIQVRSKDSKPYHPIYSNTFQRKVSNKNHAFYFKKDFMVYLQSLSKDYPYIVK